MNYVGDAMSFSLALNVLFVSCSNIVSALCNSFHYIE
jgi:hypothetical protein